MSSLSSMLLLSVQTLNHSFQHDKTSENSCPGCLTIEAERVFFSLWLRCSYLLRTSMCCQREKKTYARSCSFWINPLASYSPFFFRYRACMRTNCDFPVLKKDIRKNVDACQFTSNLLAKAHNHVPSVIGS